MSVAPLSDDAASNRSSSSSELHSMKKEKAGVKVKACFTGPSMHITL
jgi:hypothetical protein